MPHELEGLICGSKNINLKGLRKITRYDGYEEDDEGREEEDTIVGEGVARATGFRKQREPMYES